MAAKRQVFSILPTAKYEGKSRYPSVPMAAKISNTSKDVVCRQRKKHRMDASLQELISCGILNLRCFPCVYPNDSKNIKTEKDLVIFQKQQKEKKKMISEKDTQVQKDMAAEVEKPEEVARETDTLSDAYFKEIADSLAYAEPPLEKDECQELHASAEKLHGELRNFEKAEHVCGPDQETWDAYAEKHMDIKNKIEQAGDARANKAPEDTCKAAITNAKKSLDDGADFMRLRCENLLMQQRLYEEQLQALKDQMEEIQKQLALEKNKEQNYTKELAHCLTSFANFLDHVNRTKAQAAEAPRSIASGLFKSIREHIKDTYYTVKFAPTRLKNYLKRKAFNAVDGVLHSVAGTFDSAIQSLENHRTSILSHSHEYQDATTFYRSLSAKLQKQNPKLKMDLMMDRRIAGEMAKAGYGAYTIKQTFLKESPNRKEMEEGKAEDFAFAAEKDVQKRRANEKQKAKESSR